MLLFCVATSVSFANSREIAISGRILSSTDEPIIGATVLLKHGDSLITGAAGDFDGNFLIRLDRSVFRNCSVFRKVSAVSTPKAEWTLAVSSIGFIPLELSLQQLNEAEDSREAGSLAVEAITDLIITLADEQVTVEGVTVVAETVAAPSFRAQTVTDVTALANRGVSVTNPIEAVRAPEVSRSGSALGSQVRFSGSNPEYTLNGASIGRDPAHYGMFSVLPSVAISEVSFSGQTLDMRQESPGQVELTSDRSFKERSSGELTLSALEAVGGYAKGTDKWFVNTSLRKSVLDKIVGTNDNTSEHRTIPPTNFQDVFISSGVKLSPSTSLYLDQYHAQDFLAFNTGATVNNSAGIDAFQHTRNRMFGAQLRHLTPSALFNLKVSARFDKAIYTANSTDAQNLSALTLDLKDNTTTIRSDADVEFSIGATQITSGIAVSHWSAPQLTLSQRNWNFLPPYSTSDNPNYYQGLVNTQYGSLAVARKGTDLALFTQVERNWGTSLLRGGFRVQRHDYLHNKIDILGRLAVAHRLNSNLTAQVSLGSYAEAPLSSLLEPYQVLVRDNLNALRSVQTRIAKASVRFKKNDGGRIDLSLFAKSIDNLPTLTPHFANESLAPVALSMQSNGSQRFYGFTAAYAKRAALTAVFGSRLDITTGYAFTLTSATTDGIATHYNEDSPHRFEANLTYHASSALQFGGLFTLRSGNRYTAPFLPLSQSSQLGQTYYQNHVASENSSRFPAHINLNLSASYKAGQWTTVANVGNALNRANPIVRAYDGFVYDASLLPSVGVTYSF